MYINKLMWDVNRMYISVCFCICVPMTGVLCYGVWYILIVMTSVQTFNQILNARKYQTEVWNLQRCCYINFLWNVYIPIVPPVDAPDLNPVLAWTRAGTSWKMKTIDHCLSVSTPTNTFEAPWKRGDVWWPPPRRLGSWGWVVFTLLLCYHGWVWFWSPLDSNQRNGDSSRPLCLLCLAEGKRGLRVQGHTSPSLLGFPWLYEWTDHNALNCTMCVTLSIHMCLCKSWMRKPFITAAWKAN